MAAQLILTPPRVEGDVWRWTATTERESESGVAFDQTDAWKAGAAWLLRDVQVLIAPQEKL